MNNPKVSILVPIYNVSAYIEACARSLFEQTYPNIEYIFVNDGTKDDSVEKLERLIEAEYPSKKASIKIINKPNEGIGRTRVRGIAEATGDYIMWLDSDDWVEPDFVEKPLKKALECGSDMVYFGFYSHEKVRLRARYGKDITPCDGKAFVHAMHQDKVGGYMWNKLVKASFYRKENIYIPEFGMHDDLVLAAQYLFDTKRVDYLRELLVHYRRDNNSSITHAGERNYRRDSAKNLLSFWEFLKSSGRVDILEACGYNLLLRSIWYAISGKCTEVLRNYPDAVLAMAKERYHSDGSRGRLKQWISILYCRFNSGKFSGGPA